MQLPRGQAARLKAVSARPLLSMPGLIQLRSDIVGHITTETEHS